MIAGTAIRSRRMRIVFTVTIGVVLALGTMVVICKSRRVIQKHQCGEQLAQLEGALANFRDTNKCLPPAALCDADGKPMHSWRVLLVPYLESNMFYDNYDLHEPWNGPNNRRLLQSYYDQSNDEPFDVTRVRSWYRCPGAPITQNEFLTNYMMIVDPNEPLIPAPPPLAEPGLEWQARMPAGGEVLVVEVHGLDVHWMEPRDLSLDEMSFLINDPAKPSISSPHIGGAFVLMVDGGVEFLSKDITKTRLRAMIGLKNK